MQPPIVDLSEKEPEALAAPFYAALREALERRKLKLENVCPPSDRVARRVLEEYGAIFIATEKVLVPPVCIFTSEEDVLRFQNRAGVCTEVIGEVSIELQPAAMEALLAARLEVHEHDLDITPRGGAEAARRSYTDTLRLWDSRILPALDYWTECNRLSDDRTATLRCLEPHKQVAHVLELEEAGIFFSKDFSKSVLYSVAAPGASQHLSMLAFDAAEFRDAHVRQILARHGWFQTVRSDLPHFTFLGAREEDLPGRGLRRIEQDAQVFWVPNLG
ncbi:MAG: hypothetical protein H0T92_09540 [Pyrinomonadaceae bacterium]|nr:hypothetical protein [Pyrinomonadaceae bacterium]